MLKYKKAKKAFELAQPDPHCLDISDLRDLQTQYIFPPEYGYSPEILDQRGRQRADQLLKMFPESYMLNSFLELGCWDAMVSCHLKRKGKMAVAVDNRDEGFDQRARDEGVELLKMDAACLKFDDNSFDMVFSYDAFEHFSNPAAVLKEICRVTKPGGYIYMEFGPLYMSPKGLHAYRQITVPYCQFLFSRQTMNGFLEKEKLGTIDFNHCNGWSLLQFRNLWESYSDRLEIIKYMETEDYGYLDLVRKYAPVFKSKTDYFDNLTCSGIKILMKKK
jgi:ubiquinone/menaquinone biosynthesis C-methylase UbiE